LHRLFALDAVAAGFVALIAMLALVGGLRLDVGRLNEIGPGLFPISLALVLLALSLVLAVVTVAKHLTDANFRLTFDVRAVVGIVGALLVFGVLMRGTFGLPALGLTGATPLAILMAGTASPETRWLHLVALAIGLTAFCTTLFRYLLGLPIPVAPWLIGY
jgi:hypothetical protein